MPKPPVVPVRRMGEAGDAIVVNGCGIQKEVVSGEFLAICILVYNKAECHVFMYA